MAPESAHEILEIILNQALGLRASDIHLEPQQNTVRVRYRIDGFLHDQSEIKKELIFSLISRIKVLAHMDIAQNRLPQDGKFSTCYAGRNIDVRVSTFPSLYGEKVVLRLLDGAHGLIALSDLGMSETLQKTLLSCVNMHSGFFLLTGPTGSGKTTTLYAILETLNIPSNHIITLEDPVEYTLKGIIQSNINPAIGFTFASGLRSMLRQDPDVVLIGEIRDLETAGVAIEAALTGHLVLSTLHTANAIGVIVRLLDIGIESFLINAALTGVMAQRLPRKICTKCSFDYTPNFQEQGLMKRIGYHGEKLHRGKGCMHCRNTGYYGRTGIFEILILSDELKALISQHPRAAALENQCKKEGMKTLYDDACERLSAGITTIEEIARVLL